jgi:DNA-binding NarL/FixJ family response regulator
MSETLSRIRVLIVAQIRLYREGLAHALSDLYKVKVVDSTASAETALRQTHELRPEVVLVDLATTGAWLLIEAIGKRFAETRVVALARDDSNEEMIRAAEVGVSGLVPREGSLEELLEAIEHALNGEFQCSPRIAHQLVQRIRHLAVNSPADRSTVVLTGREFEIAELIDSGLSNKQIAIRLWIEESTVKNHVHNILSKLGVHRRGEASAKLRPLLAQRAFSRQSLGSDAS